MTAPSTQVTTLLTQCRLTTAEELAPIPYHTGRCGSLEALPRTTLRSRFARLDVRLRVASA